MKKVFYVFALAILFAACGPIYAQSEVAGTWQVDGVGNPFPWQVFLKGDGSRLTGMVSHCAPNSSEIYEASSNGDTVTFKCKSTGDEGRTITFTGTLNGDEIEFTQEVRIRDGGILPGAGNRMFGPSAPRRFTAKRVPDGELAELAGSIRGLKLYAGVSLVKQDVTVAGSLFLPEKVSRVHAVIVVVRYGLGFSLEGDPRWERLSEATGSGFLLAQFSNIGPSALHGHKQMDKVNRVGVADALLMLLRNLAQQSGRKELADVPLVLWGHSAGGSVGITFAELHPQRTIAFVNYHADGLTGQDLKGWSHIPVLLLTGGKDTQAVAERVQDLSKGGRALGAPWTFAVDPDATHGGEEYLKKANDLMISWITAVIRQRVSPDGKTLRAVTEGSAWMGNNQTGEFAPYGTFTGSKPEASWLPDEASARGWRVVLGVK